MIITQSKHATVQLSMKHSHSFILGDGGGEWWVGGNSRHDNCQKCLGSTEAGRIVQGPPRIEIDFEDPF